MLCCCCAFYISCFACLRIAHFISSVKPKQKQSKSESLPFQMKHYRFQQMQQPKRQPHHHDADAIRKTLNSIQFWAHTHTNAHSWINKLKKMIRSTNVFVKRKLFGFSCQTQFLIVRRFSFLFSIICIWFLNKIMLVSIELAIVDVVLPMNFHLKSVFFFH